MYSKHIKKDSTWAKTQERKKTAVVCVCVCERACAERFRKWINGDKPPRKPDMELPLPVSTYSMWWLCNKGSVYTWLLKEQSVAGWGHFFSQGHSLQYFPYKVLLNLAPNCISYEITKKLIQRIKNTSAIKSVFFFFPLALAFLKVETD